MKTAVLLPLVATGAAAFAPSSSFCVKKSASLLMTDVPVESIEEEEVVVPSFPTINGWTADPSKFCAGLPGALDPLGDFDPLGFTKELPVQEIKRFREAEVTHGRVSMLAVVGYLVAENFHPLFGGVISGPANSHLGQVQEVAPFFFAWLTMSIAAAELTRAKIGWEFPLDAVAKNKEIEGKTWLTKLNDEYYPGDIGFDPLGLKPTDASEFAVMQTKELNNGRLAMFAAMGMIVQEQVTQQALF